MPYLADPATTITLYFCGSGNNLSAYKGARFAVPALFHHALGRHNGFDGVGGNAANDAFFQRTATRSVVQTRNGAKIYQGPRKGVKPKTQTFAPKTGRGTNQIAADALDWLIGQTQKPAPLNQISQINLVGHSRGAVTATMLSWAIQHFFAEEYPRLRVNLFLFDPVAGSLNEFDRFTSHGDETFFSAVDRLPRIVTNFAAVVAGRIQPGAKDRTFLSTVPAQGNGGRESYRIYTLPGGHNAPCQFHLASGGGVAGQIGLHLAQKFLVENGSQFNSDFTMTDDQVLEAYAKIRLTDDMMIGHASGARGALAKGNAFPLSAHRAEPIRAHNPFLNHPFFMNIDHYEAFQRRYRAAAQELRVHRVVGAANAMALIAGTTPKTLHVLRQLGLLEEPETGRRRADARLAA